MPTEARPVCPHCGGALLTGQHNELTCVQHGVFFPAQTLDAALGAGASQRAQTLAVQGRAIGHRCPQDRLGLSRVSNASGRVTAEACARCGGLWLASDVLAQVIATTPPPPGRSAPEARSLLAFAAVKSILLPQTRPPGA